MKKLSFMLIAAVCAVCSTMTAQVRSFADGEVLYLNVSSYSNWLDQNGQLKATFVRTDNSTVQVNGAPSAADSTVYGFVPGAGDYNSVSFAFMSSTSDIPFAEGNCVMTFAPNSANATFGTFDSRVPVMMYTMVGDSAFFGSAWNLAAVENDMQKVNDSIYTWTADSIHLVAASYEYKLVGNLDTVASARRGWDGYQLPMEGNYSLNIAEAGYYGVTFTANVNNHTVNATTTLKKADYVPVMVYTMVGDSAIFGSAWNLAAVGNDMQKVNDSIYTWTADSIHLAAAAYEYKLVGNLDTVAPARRGWDNYQLPMEGNYSLSIAEAGYYSVVFTANVASHTLTAEKTLKKADYTPVMIYTMVGDSAIFGSAWNLAAVENDMQKVNDSIYTWSVDSIHLDAVAYEYKLVGNLDSVAPARRSWDGYQLPMEGNFSLNIAEDGYYGVTFTANVAAHTLSAEKTLKKADYTPMMIYTMVGDSAIFGSAWNLAAVENDMQKVNDSIYTWTADSIHLAAAAYEYKLVGNLDSVAPANRGWDSYQLPMEGNYSLIIAEGGYYTVEFTANVKSHTVNALTTLKKADYTPVMVYTMVGDSAIFGSAWKLAAVENDMQKVNDSIYTWSADSIHLAAAAYEYKLVGNLDSVAPARRGWDSYQLPMEGNFSLIIAEDGYYGLTFTANVAAHTLTAEKTLKKADYTPVMIYTMVGDSAIFGSAWSLAAVENDMQKVNDSIYTWSADSIHLAAAAYEYKLVGNLDSVAPANRGWDSYQLPMEGNYSLIIAEAGYYSVVFTANVASHTLTAEKTLKKADYTPVMVYTMVGDSAIFGSAWNLAAVENDMQKVNDSIYTWSADSIHLAAAAYEYKLVGNLDSVAPARRGWDSYQLPMEGNYSLNIAEAGYYGVTFTANLASHRLTAEKTLKKADYTPVMVYTMVGDSAIFGSAWNLAAVENDMQKVNDSIYTWSVDSIHLAAADYEYKLVGNLDTVAPANRGWDSYQLPMEGNYSLNIAEAGYYGVTFTANVAAHTLSVEKTLKKADYTPVMIYTMVGDSAIFGSAWNLATVENDMQKVNDSIYTWTADSIHLAAAAYEYKLVGNLDSVAPARRGWDGYQLPMEGNYSLNIAEAGYYSVVFTANVASHTLTAEKTLKKADYTPVMVYTMVGDSAIFGSAWNLAAVENDMQKVNDSIYTWTADSIHLAAAAYEYKLVGNLDTVAPANRGWDNYQLPIEGNYSLNIAEGGYYSVEFTANVKSHTVNALTTLKKADYVPVMVYTMVGDSAIFGSAWNLAAVENDMQKVNDSIYTWTADSIHLAAAAYEYKLVGNLDTVVPANRGWDNYQLPMEGNYSLNIAEAGYYSVEFTADVKNHTVNALTTLKKADYTPVMIYTMVGDSAIFGSAWNLAAVENDMQKVNDSIYTWTADSIHLAAAAYEYKLVGNLDTVAPANRGWDSYQLPTEGNYSMQIEEGGYYAITFTANVAAHTLTAAKELLNADPTPVVYPEHLYILGNISGKEWNEATPDEMTNAGNGHYTLEVDFSAETSYFAFATAGGTWDIVNANRYAGIANDLVSPDTDGTLAKGSNNCFTIAGGRYTVSVDWNTMSVSVVRQETGVSNVAAQQSAKVLRDGKQVVIIRGEHEYSPQGQLLK